MSRPARSRLPGDAEVDLLGPTELGAAAHVAARALHDDPMFVFLSGDTERRGRAMPVYLRALLQSGLAGRTTYVVRRGAVVCGVAGWLPPGAYPLPVSRRLRQSLGALRALSLVPRSIPAGLRALSATERAHPAEEHWYLALLAVEPAEQGHGFGAALVQEILGREGADFWPAYLETTNARNVPWYRRFGFEVERELRPFSSGPSIWTMRRPSAD
ncbi:MAG: GNAT family N-acetyltransferase [Actinobacteria bacterium]|nr:GNAT family N-acetyltransferase [Actinomycetota bacterium]